MIETAVYTLGAQPIAAHARLALRRLSDCARLIVVCADDDIAQALTAFGLECQVIVLRGDFAAGYAAGLGVANVSHGHVLLTGDHALGPIGVITPAGAFHSTYAQRNIARLTGIPTGHEQVLPSLDLLLLDAAHAQSQALRQALRAGAKGRPPYRAEIALGALNARPSYGVAPGITANEGWFDPARAVREGAQCLPAGLLTLDPLLHDLTAIDLRAALHEIAKRDPEMADAIRQTMRETMAPRHLATLTDAYAVLPTTGPDETEGCGEIAVLIHAYYPEMIDELLDIAARIPAKTALFISTASASSAAMIQARLAAKDMNAEVRIVGQNRGRDMSALFITFADVMQSGQYALALRLHSKQTPHVHPSVAEGFRTHLFENLAASPAYVAQILQRFHDDPALGLVIPPAIQIGFGALGHGWYNNRPSLTRWAAKLGIETPLDDHTPVAPFGTMFWFRPAALAKLFAHPWRWEDYNPEPHHVDGGLAHVQERLIGYAVPDAGYDILQVMTPDQAARNYARLEYKFQLFAGHLASASVAEQYRQISALNQPRRRALYGWLEGAYARTLRRWPRLRPWVAPLARKIAITLLPG